MIDWERLLDSFATVVLFFIFVAAGMTMAFVIGTSFGLAGYLFFLSFIFAVISTYIYKGFNK